MASVNKVILIGNLGKDPEMRYMPDGKGVANFTMATTDRWKDKNSGEQKEATEWHRVVFFGKAAELIGEYVHKGDPIYVEGKLKTRKWQDKDGNDRYTTEVVGEQFQFLKARGGDGSYGGDESPAPKRAASKPAAPAPNQVDNLDDDIPF